MNINQKKTFLYLHQYFFMSLIILLLAQKILKIFPILSFITYIDEVLLLYFFIIFGYSLMHFKIKKYILLLLGSLLYLITISIINANSNIQSIILQSFIHMKFFIFYYLVNKYLTFKNIKNILYFLFYFTLIGVAVHLLMQESFNHFFLQKIDYRGSLLRIGGFQLSPNLLGLTLGLFYFFFIFKKKISRYKMILTTIIFTIIIFITGSRIGLSAILIGIIFYYLSLNTIYKIYMIPIISILFIGFSYIIISSDILEKTLINISTLTMNSSESGYIRGIMIYNGFLLLIENFPVGTGAATFGSVLSKGSTIYQELGLSHRSFFINMQGIYDSNIASIAGEFGIIGFFIFFILLKSIYKSIKTNNNRFFLNSLFIILLFSALVNPVFANSYLSILFSLFLVYIKKRTTFENINSK